MKKPALTVMLTELTITEATSAMLEWQAYRLILD
jgi:hypothetical protein